MRRLPHGCFAIIILAAAMICVAGRAEVQNKPQKHPMNEMLERLYPRNFPMRFPEVPRISALQALKLYENHEALFVHIGEDSPNIVGCVKLTEFQASHLDVKKLRSLAGQRVIITYCG